MSRGRTCPTPRKTKHRDELGAKMALARLSTKVDDRERRAYRCPCGSWHLTSRALPSQNA